MNIRGYNWTFTLNNPEEPDWEKMRDIFTSVDDDTKRPRVKYLIFQEEEGQNGTPHFQGQICFKYQMTLRRVRDYFSPSSPHIEKTISLKDSIAYCQKEEGRIDGPWEAGTPPKQGKRSDLEKFKKDFEDGMSYKDLAINHISLALRSAGNMNKLVQIRDEKKYVQRKPNIIWYFGVSGAGKSYDMATICENQSFYRQVFCKNNFWGLYSGEDILWIDEFSGWKHVPRELFNQLWDGYKLDLNVKNGYAPFRAKTILITSQLPPEHSYRRTWTDRKGNQKALKDDEWNSFLRRLDAIDTCRRYIDTWDPNNPKKKNWVDYKPTIREIYETHCQEIGITPINQTQLRQCWTLDMEEEEPPEQLTGNKRKREEEEEDTISTTSTVLDLECLEDLKELPPVDLQPPRKKRRKEINNLWDQDVNLEDIFKNL